MCHEVLEKLGDANDPTFKLALKLEEIALSDEYFIERKLYPNVDFFSGAVYTLLGIPSILFTPIFAIARAPGWLAHILEQRSDNRLYRPKSLYVGPEPRGFIPLNERKE